MYFLKNKYSILIFFLLLVTSPLFGQSNEAVIVVLGSSTAAGIGPSDPANTWVNRYRSYLQSVAPNTQVINLAVGGFTSYHIMPTDYVATGGRPQPRNESNITKAISYLPCGIIINLPSNDGAFLYSVEEQLANFEAIVAEATTAAISIPVWISTTQPRNLSVNQTNNLKAVKDSLLARYGDQVIDFWSGLAQESGHILLPYNSGDGVHLNDEAHQILFERVAEKPICGFEPRDITAVDVPSESAFFAAPKIWYDGTNINTELMATTAEVATLTVYDFLGKKITQQRFDIMPHRLNSNHLNISYLSDKGSIYFLKYQVGQRIYSQGIWVY